MQNTINLQPITLQQLGWQPFFQQQLTLEDYEQAVIARVIAHHRSGYELLTKQGRHTLPILSQMPLMTVGDWVLLDQQNRFSRLLDRHSLFSRKAAGTKIAEQYIAANVDTVFIVCSLNQDFNLNRIERYLTLAREAQVEPVVVLTKADLCTDAESKRQQVQKLDPMLMTECVNSLEPESVQPLMQWCGKGKTVTFLGSSGVGKSTLINTLMGHNEQKTAGIRADDDKGRHTTTSRSLHFLPRGGILLDTPGMRELQLADCQHGLRETFSDIEALATRCRFSDCHHQTEPGCAVQRAVESGNLDPRRLKNYLKLLREQERNSASLAELRAKERQFSKLCRSVKKERP
ncbi:ribosome small subunit-dependent GTPase A [Vibrio albus]|uniref:Small ribosomal subunit biogenesis GTPase RsgA n=1 Tax=Vibrio albus TaxID=2200953 RepID=A0A2U3B7B4_9VIBR|nr:ribosome small subunit-dependent GTPase A [Vibrio albus]PWI32605.1 ribosome small subunit-dependent GTPase A [Vibrio albus]